MEEQYRKIKAFLRKAKEKVSNDYYSCFKTALAQDLPFEALSDALLTSCKKDDTELMELLLKKGAKPSEMAICLCKSMRAASLLIEAGADVRADGDMPLQIAALRGNYDLVRFLITRGSDYLAFEGLAFWVAASRGHINIMRFMYCLGGIKVPREPNAFAFSAVASCHSEAVVFLLTGCGMSFAAFPQYLSTVMMMYNNEYKKVETLRALIESGADLHYEDEDILHKAVAYKECLIIKYLLDNGANVRAQNDKALKIAKRGRSRRVKNLILAQYSGAAYIWATLFLAL